MNNLTQRVITALLLVAILLLLLFKAGQPAFAAVLYGFGLLAVWELWRLVQTRNTVSLWIMLLVYSAVAIELWVSQSIAIIGAIGFIHLLVTTYVLRFKPGLSHLLTGIYGAVLLAAVMVSMTVLQSLGAWVLLTAMIVVWAADVGGYFFGKGFGGTLIARPLAPTISPKKSWEGAIGGALLAVIITLACALTTDAITSLQVWAISGSRLTSRMQTAGWFGFLTLMVVLPTLVVAAYSVTGDLVESLLKRQAGVKDSSQLLPGHGGILDRIDALIPVLPLCAAWAYYVGYYG